VIEEGRIDARPGYTNITNLNDRPNSIRRLNDPSGQFAPTGYINVGGVGTLLFAGIPNDYTPITSGFSGDPLSLIPFRPEQSPQSMMYVYDKNKQVKIRANKQEISIGTAPPNKAPSIEYGIPADKDIETGQNVTGWTVTGSSSAVALSDRTDGSDTITSILFVSGNSGWCCINPNISDTSWAGERMKVILDSGGGNEEAVAIRNILPAIKTTTVQAVLYDIGLSGMCSLVLTGSPHGVDRNTLININGEIVRVLAVVPAPTGTDYSIRCSTLLPHFAGDSVTGLISWFAYTTNNHVAGETITSKYIAVTQGTGTGSAQADVAVDGSLTSNFRQIVPSDDYLHISIYLQNPQNVTNVQLLLSLDATPNFSFLNPGNSYIWTFTQAQLKIDGSSSASWVDVVVPISSGVRSGEDFTRTIANIQGMAVQLITTGSCNYGFDWLYFFGTYGQVIQPNSPVGVRYQERFRDSSTGSKSVPGPLTREQLFPLREAVIVTPVAPTQALDNVDTIDIYRIGGLVTSPLYVASLQSGIFNPYTDGLSDATVLETNQPPDLTAIQPWPITQPTQSGTVNVVGTSVTLVGGGPFDLNLMANTAIILGGTAYQLFGTPRSTTFIELTQDAGVQTNAYYIINEPTLAAQSLPFAFGPLEGPFAPVLFALGDSINGGLLYFSNFGSLDSASDTNTVELAPPSDDLVSGAVWNGMAIAGNKDKLFCIRYSYLSSISEGGSNAYQWAQISAAPSGMWSRWSCCACPLGVAYLGRDGIYLATDSASVNITDEKLYPLFPHDGQPAHTVTIGTDVILPVDMTQLDFLRMSYCDETLRFCYKDIAGNFVTLIYEIYKKRWLPSNYYDGINYHYLVEEPAGGTQSMDILMLSVNFNRVLLAGGDTDAGQDIHTTVTLPSMDGGDERTQKLYVDSMVQLDHGNSIEVEYVATYDWAQTTSPPGILMKQTGIYQVPVNLASLSDLELHHNVGAKFSWAGGPSGAKLYAWEVSAFPQPYLMDRFETQFGALSFPGWKHMRRAFPALISNQEVIFTIVTQDGRVFSYTIPTSNGQYRIFPIMLDQNIKDLAFALQIETAIPGTHFAPFFEDWTVETKEWTEETYIKLALFRA
jgi:hypothetical protein